MDILKKYFPDLTPLQTQLFSNLLPLYNHWNQLINVISRRDMENFYINHVLHSLSIGKIIQFLPGTSLLDIGTGGGFPGIPLAIMFPQCRFYLIDSIEKKVKVVREISSELGLENVTPLRGRAEDISGKYDFVISRAVTALPEFVKWTKGKINPHSSNSITNGILYLKGGDFDDELGQISLHHKVSNISDFFDEPFFETKKIVHLYRPI